MDHTSGLSIERVNAFGHKIHLSVQYTAETCADLVGNIVLVSHRNCKIAPDSLMEIKRVGENCS